MGDHGESWEIMGDSGNGLAEFHKHLLTFLPLQQLRPLQQPPRTHPWRRRHCTPPPQRGGARLRRPRRRFAPLLLLLVQARRARPIRGEASQACQGQASRASDGREKPCASVPSGLRRFFRRKNRNPQILDMPAWSNFDRFLVDFELKITQTVLVPHFSR